PNRDELLLGRNCHGCYAFGELHRSDAGTSRQRFVQPENERKSFRFLLAAERLLSLHIHRGASRLIQRLLQDQRRKFGQEVPVLAHEPLKIADRFAQSKLLLLLLLRFGWMLELGTSKSVQT